MTIGKILRKSWQITWKHKALWWFGALNTLYGKWDNPDGVSDGVGRTLSNYIWPFVSQLFEAWGGDRLLSFDEIVVFNFSFHLLIAFIVFGLPTLGFIGVYRGALQIINGQEINLKILAKEGQFRFLSILAFTFLFYWLALIFGAPLLHFAEQAQEGASLIIILIPIVFLVLSGGFTTIVYGGLLVENKGLFSGLKYSWNVFWTKPVWITWVSFIGAFIDEILDSILTSLFGIYAYAIGILPYAIVEAFTSVIPLVIFLSLTLDDKSKLQPE